MNVNREDTERSIYPKTHTSDENIEKVWNPVCVDRSKQNQTCLLYRNIEEVSQICAKKNSQLKPTNWFLHYNNTPAHQTLSAKTFRDWNTPLLNQTRLPVTSGSSKN